MKTTDYNGWTNYATWRIQLELADDYVTGMFDGEDDWLKEQREMSVTDMADCIKDYVYEILELNVSDDDFEHGLVKSYASAFLDEVNWYELGKHAIDALQEDYKYKQLTEV